MRTSSHIASLIIRHLRNGLNDDEIEELYAWRYESAENEELFQQINKKDGILEMLKGYYISKRTVLNKLESNDPSAKKKIFQKTRWLPQWIKSWRETYKF